MAVVQVDGVSLAYDDLGAGDPAIVWIHGGTTNRSYWHRFQIPHFGDRHRCVAVDLRGHGDSDKPGGPCPITRFAADVAGLIETLQLDRPIVVGHSFGCAVAIQLAASRPELTRAIVLNDGPSMVAPALERYLPMIEAFSSGTPVGEVMNTMFTNSGFFLDRHDPELRHQIVALCTAPNHSATETIRALAEWDRDAVKGKITFPALHLPGAKSACPEDQIIDAIPQVVLARTVGGGHFNAWEVPAQVNSMITEFLREYVD
ncbi:MAG: alpha/beta fold hydrolase [Acidimicrobiales bacterium]